MTETVQTEPLLKETKREISKNLKKLHQLTNRSWFFEQCYEHHVVPNTLIVKAPKHSVEFDPNAQNLYKNAATKASLHNLQIAKKSSKFEAARGYEKFEEFKKELEEKGVDMAKVQTYINCRGPQISHQIKHSYHQKLQHLKRKTGFYTCWSKIVHLHLP